MTDAQVAGGHKATLNNPHTSDEAKEHSKKVLDGEYNGGDGQFSPPPPHIFIYIDKFGSSSIYR